MSDHELAELVQQRWNALNQALTHLPKFQNRQQAGASAEQLAALESKLKQSLPKEIRAVIQTHNGREHLGYGLGYRLPTTDLLPIDQWEPYEQSKYNFVDDLLQCLADPKDQCADQHLREDFREHFAQRASKAKDLSAWNSIPCELLIIGRGMDDYAEEYLLSLRSGRIYLAVHNIPEWKSLGSFADWVDKALKNVEDQRDDMKEQHEELEIV